MKKIINKIPDKYYLISMAFILFIMVLGRYMFPDLMNKWDMVIYFLPQLFLPFTIIFILYFYIKDNHSKKIVDKIYLFKLIHQKESDLLVLDNKKIFSLFILYMLLWPIQLHVIGMYFLPALLYLTLINMPSQYKIHTRFIYAYKYINIIFLSFFVLNIFLPPELEFIPLNLNSIYFIVLYVYFLLLVIFLIYLKLKLERNSIYLISSIIILFIVMFMAQELSYYYWLLIFMLGFMMPYYKNYITSILLVLISITYLMYMIDRVQSFLPSATPHLYLWQNHNKCMIKYPQGGVYYVFSLVPRGSHWTGGHMMTITCEEALLYFREFRYPYMEQLNEKHN